MKRLGERIKRKRENLNMQLSELASRVGVSPSALSQIEKAKAFPSIVTLKSIADKLYTTVGELIGENDALSNNPLVRFDEINFVDQNKTGCSLYLLSNHGNNKQMDTLLLKFNKGANAEGLIKTHPGQTFLFILEGSLMVTLDENTYTLKPNDSFYFNSNRPHHLENLEGGTTSVLLVSTPPME